MCCRLFYSVIDETMPKVTKTLQLKQVLVSPDLEVLEEESVATSDEGSDRMISGGSCTQQPWNVRHSGKYRTRAGQYSGSVHAPGTCLPGLAFLYLLTPLVHCIHAT